MDYLGPETRNLYQRQEHFSARSVEKKKMFFRPHPPRAFGFAIRSHRSHGKTFLSLVPCQRYVKHNFLILSRVPLGVQDKDIQ
jgi:hypothetical protein